jgi:predicted transcriptional regulator of viral defense system
MHLYEIRDKALKTGRAVYSVQQLANLIGKSKTIAKVYFSRLTKKNLARKLLRGKITFEEDDEIIATQLVEPSYISLNSALLFHKSITQIPSNTECVTTKNSIRFGQLGIVYHKIPPALFYGYSRHRKGNSYIFLADKEKALLDAVYLNLVSKDGAREIAATMDGENIKKLIQRFNGRGRKKLEAWLL